jgi:hypothetical protein
MYRRDYILRLIERFAEALIAIRNRLLKREADSGEVLRVVREIAADAGLDLTVARSLDPATLLMWLAPTGEIDEPRLWLMAELLYLEGLQARNTGSPAWRADFERALAIYSRLRSGWRPSDGLATPHERSAELRRLLQEDLPRHPR